jgi:hypothetical protein
MIWSFNMGESIGNQHEIIKSKMSPPNTGQIAGNRPTGGAAGSGLVIGVVDSEGTVTEMVKTNSINATSGRVTLA